MEVFISGIETILFDILIGLVGSRYLLKPYMAKRLADAVARITRCTASRIATTPPGDHAATSLASS